MNKGSSRLVYINCFCNNKKDSDIIKNNSILYSKKIIKIINIFIKEYIIRYFNSIKFITKFNFFIIIYIKLTEWGGIRTHDTKNSMVVFKTTALNPSATHPIICG